MRYSIHVLQSMTSKTFNIFTKFKILTVMILFILTLSAKSQVSSNWWRFNGSANDDDAAYDIAVDGSGNMYVTGFSTGTGTGKDITTIKYNSSGIREWVVNYNGSSNNNDEATSIVIDKQNNIYVTGFSTNSNTATDYTTIKYNSDGARQWVAIYNGTQSSYDYSNSIIVDNEGNIYVTGSSYGNGDLSNILTIKYDSLGEQLWTATYSGSGNSNNYADQISVDNSGNVYVCGNSTGIGSGQDYVTIKYDSNGIQQYVARYNGTDNYNDYPHSMALDNNGNVYVTGGSYGIGSDMDYVTIKYNSSLEEQWIARYNGTGNSYDEANGIALSASGNVLITGGSTYADNIFNMTTIKYSSDGVQQWVTRSGDNGNSQSSSYAIAVNNGENLFISGYVLGVTGGENFSTFKLNSDGSNQWGMEYNGTGNSNDISYSLQIDGSGNIYACGSSESASAGSDFLTMKYYDKSGINQISNAIPEKFSLSQNYPNPFNPATKIKFEIMQQGFVKLSVFDMLGKEVSTLVNENLKAGSYETEFDGNGLMSGVYFYRIETENFSEVRKMTLIK